MTSHSTERLAGIDVYHLVDWSDVRTEQIHQTPGPLNNVVSQLLNICVERKDRW